MNLLRRLRMRASNMSYADLSKTKFTKLENRSLLILNGPESQKILQGIMTNDIREFKEIEKGELKFKKIALYTLFLQQKGKIITDAFVFKPRLYHQGKPEYPADQYWIDVPKEAKKDLKQHIKKHLWRKQAEIYDVEEEGDDDYKPKVYSGFNEDGQVLDFVQGGSIQLEEMQKGEDETYANLIFFDPRGTKFGLRIVAMQPQISVQGNIEYCSEDQYQLLYQQLGEVPFEYIKAKLPFQFNFDLMNAISLKKGCYMGQQMVSRGMRVGIIRRRTFPFLLQNNQETLPIDTPIKVGQQVIGKVLFSSAGQGGALINYLPLLENSVQWPLKFTSPLSGTLLNPFEDKLLNYYTEMKDKQKIMEELDL